MEKLVMQEVQLVEKLLMQEVINTLPFLYPIIRTFQSEEFMLKRNIKPSPSALKVKFQEFQQLVVNTSPEPKIGCSTTFPFPPRKQKNEVK